MVRDEEINMKERDTVILPVRIKKPLLDKVHERVIKRKVSRNSWVLKAIQEGLRSHKSQNGHDTILNLVRKANAGLKSNCHQ